MVQPPDQPHEGGGSEGRKAPPYVAIGLVFLLSCAVAAGLVALHQAGSLGALFGPRLAPYDPDAPAPPPEPSTEPGAGPARPEGPSRPSRAHVAGGAKAHRRGAAGAGGAAALGEGTLAVHCARPCRVLVDGAIVGEATPWLKVKVPSGDHRVRVDALEGEVSDLKRVLVAPDRVREVRFELGGKRVEDFQNLEGTEGWDE